MKTLSKINAVAGITAILIFSGAANAGSSHSLISDVETRGKVKSVRVYHADLNLSEEMGRATFNERLDNAVEMVCGPTSLRLAGSLGALRKNEECVDKAKARAWSQVESTSAMTANQE